MSSLFLVIGLIATFSTIAVLGLLISAATSDRRRAVRLLETQVSEVSTNLRSHELSQSFVDRAVSPLATKLGGLARRVSPSDGRGRIDRRIALAGRPEGWDAEKVAALKIIAAVGGILLALLLGKSANASGTSILGLGLLLGGIAFYTPNAILARKAEDRQNEIRTTLPDTMDLLTISVEAGLGFDAALVQVMNHVPGALTQEIGRMLQEMRLGKSRVDAFRSLADRTDVEELRSFVLAMVQADTFGVSISKVLRAQAKELRTKRRQRAEEQAMRVPIKILFPMILCVLPALFVVVLGPGAIRIAQNLFGLSG